MNVPARGTSKISDRAAILRHAQCVVGVQCGVCRRKHPAGSAPTLGLIARWAGQWWLFELARRSPYALASEAVDRDERDRKTAALKEQLPPGTPPRGRRNPVPGDTSIHGQLDHLAADDTMPFQSVLLDHASTERRAMLDAIESRAEFNGPIHGKAHTFSCADCSNRPTKRLVWLFDQAAIAREHESDAFII